jgi:microcystin-dependent protein
MYSSDVAAGDDILAAQYNNLRKDSIPIGGIISFSGSDYPLNRAPGGWLICDGSAVSRALYAGLFSIIGTVFGSGDGSTTFNLPDKRDKYSIGKSGTKALGSTGGSNTTTLTTAILPSHRHTIAVPSTHTHTITKYDNTGSSSYIGLIKNDFASNFRSATSSADGSHDHGGATGSEGGGDPFNSEPKNIALNFIIKHG